VNRFQEWFRKKYSDWRGDAIGHERTQKGFAEYLDIPDKVLSTWMRGSKPTSHVYIQKLREKYKDEVYKYLEIPVPLEETELYDSSPDEAERIIRRWAKDHGYRVELYREDDPEDKPG